MMITTILFDLDGTLLDTLEDLKNSVNFALAAKGYPERSLEEVRSFIGNGIKKLVERAAPAEIGTSAYQELLASFRCHYRSHCAKTTKPFEGISALVAELKARGVSLGVVSNKNQEETQALIREFFGEDFSFVLGSSEEIPRKPHPVGIRKALAYFNTAPENTLYVGDSDVDVATAHNAGLRCIGVDWGFRGRAVLMAAGADAVVDAPAEILSLWEAEQ